MIGRKTTFSLEHGKSWKSICLNTSESFHCRLLYVAASVVKQASRKQQMNVATWERKSRIEYCNKPPHMQHLELRKEKPKGINIFLKCHKMFFQHLTKLYSLVLFSCIVRLSKEHLT